MRAKPGSDVTRTVESLRERVRLLRNARTTSQSPLDLRDLYLLWADQTEQVLRSLFVTVQLDQLHTERFWYISRLTSETARPWELLYAEIDVQAERLEALATSLEDQQKRWRPTAPIAVPDTNIFLHFDRFETLDWREVVDEPLVRLVVPIRVVEELDLKTAAQRKDLAKRARAVLAQLASLLRPTGGCPAQLGDAVTIEVFIGPDSDRQTGPQRADAEILDACEYISFLAGDPVTLVTGDVSMQLRAAVANIPCIAMPEKFRLHASEEAQAAPR